MSEDVHHGHCLCGAVTVDVTGPLGTVSACHCGACTRWTGSVLMSLEIPRDRVRSAGPIKTYASSSFAERAWCEDCGTAVWFADTKGDGAKVLELAPGLFDGFGGAKLTRVVYADSAPDGVALAGDLQRVSKADYEAENLHVEDGQ
tara:strand:+ start:140091 stop:140528 length:438 start_codon:yes stop_codon:yes gene_type:complete